jgi:hypothetical protein
MGRIPANKTFQQIDRQTERKYMKPMNRWTLTLLFVLLFLPSAVFSAGFPTKEELCSKGDCRGPGKIKLIKEDGSIFEQKFEYLFPIIQPMGFNILAGEQIRITGNFVDQKLTDIRTLAESDQ